MKHSVFSLNGDADKAYVMVGWLHSYADRRRLAGCSSTCSNVAASSTNCFGMFMCGWYRASWSCPSVPVPPSADSSLHTTGSILPQLTIIPLIWIQSTILKLQQNTTCVYSSPVQLKAGAFVLNLNHWLTYSIVDLRTRSKSGMSWLWIGEALGETSLRTCTGHPEKVCISC